MIRVIVLFKRITVLLIHCYPIEISTVMEMFYIFRLWNRQNFLKAQGTLTIKD